MNDIAQIITATAGAIVVISETALKWAQYFNKKKGKRKKK